MLALLFACSLALDDGATTRAAVSTPDGLERAIAVLDGLERVEATVNFVGEPLEEVVEDLNWFLEVPLVADWAALDAIGVDGDDEVTLRVEAQPLSTVLAALALRLGDAFGRPCIEAYAGQVLLTTPEATAAMRATDVYDVRDLVAHGGPIEALRGPPSGPGEPADEPPTPTAPGGSGDDPAPSTRPLTPGEELMTLIAEHVDPDAWIDLGGTRATIGERGGALLVTAAPSLHRNLRDVLRRMRRTFTPVLGIDAVIVELPRATMSRLTRRHDRSSVTLAQAMLAAPDAATLWRAATGATPGHEIRFEARADRAGTPVDVNLEMMPRLEAETGRLTVALSIKTVAGGDRRAAATTVTMLARAGAAIVELPAAEASDDARLLVLIPHR